MKGKVKGMEKEEKIDFYLDETDENVSFYVIEQTRINNVNYLLVAESLEDDGEAYILKDLSAPEDNESVYQMVEDDEELKLVGKIFGELLEDIELG